MQEWQIPLTQLYDYLEERDKKSSLIQDIDRTILRGNVTPLGFAREFTERLLDRVDADGLLFFQREGSSYYTLRRAIPPSGRKLPEQLDTAHIPKSSGVLRRDTWPNSDDWIPANATSLLCQPLMFGEEQWGLLIFYWSRPVIAGETFIYDVISQLSIGIATLISRERLVLFQDMHSLFFEKELDQKACLEIVREKTAAILKEHAEPILLQILFTDATATDPETTNKPLVIQWSSNTDEVGVRVPLESFSGRAMRSGLPYLLGDPTAPDFAETYKAFTPGTRTELAVVLRKESGSEPLGVLNLESPEIEAFSPDEIERISGLIGLVSPMLAAVRRRVAMARTEKALAADAINQTLDRLGGLYEHKFHSLQLGLESSLTFARRLLAAGRAPDAAAKLAAMAEELTGFQASLNDIWRRIQTVSRIGPTSVSGVVAELLKEERFTSERYVTVDSRSLEEMPPIRASGLLKEHLRNLLNNAVRAVERRQAGESSEYKGHISINAEQYAHSPNVESRGRATLAAMNQRVRITIRDNGIGLLPGSEEKIFEIGYTTWGTGFGLAAARQYARELGGNVKAVGRQGEGCAIIVELPLYVPDEDNDVVPAGDRY